MGFAHPCGNDEQVQVMVAERDDGAIFEAAYKTQHLECLRAAVDDVAGDP